MKRAVFTVFFLMAVIGSAFAASETIDELIAQLEGKSPETAAQEREQKQSVEEAKKEIEVVKKQLRFQTDKFKNVTWTRTRLGQFGPRFDIYCGERNDKIWMRILIEPSGDTKPMLTELVYLNIDGDVKGFHIKADDRKTTSEVRSSKGLGGKIEVRRWFYETVDMSVTDPELENLLRRAASAKSVMVRFSGQYNQDFNLSKDWQKSFDAMLRYYKARQTILAHEKGE